MSQILVFMLMADAARVAIGLAQGENMWKYIVAYWVILTMKNFVDLVRW